MWNRTKAMNPATLLVFTVLVFTLLVSSSDVEEAEDVDSMMLELYDQQMQETFGELNLGQEYFEGDIILSKKQSDFLQHVKQNDDSPNGTLVNGVRKLWPNNTVPYTIARGLREISRLNIKSAIQEWKDKVCVTFKEKQDDDKDYIEFAYEGGCSSSVGHIGGRQVVSVGSTGTEYAYNSCRSSTPYGSNVTVTCSKGNILHEIGHALGFLHEHNRPDRDQYLTVIWENVMPGCRVYFKKESFATLKSSDVDYDYSSVMHYGSFFFARERGLRTLRPKTKGARVGQREKLSDLDVKQGRLLYQCDEDNA